jgi:DNA-binding transcriptional ArsR family regulator
MVMQSVGGDVFHAVADSTRRAILQRLRGGGQAVNDIARAFPVSRPAISKHLRVLSGAKLVVEQREGRRRIYHLNAAPLREVDRWLDQYREFWIISLANLKKHVESQGAKR